MNLLSWLKLVESIGPLVLATTPLAPIAPFVVTGIQFAEQIPGADGPTKLAIATQIVNIGVAATNAQIGHQKIDPALVNTAVTSGITAVVSAVKVVENAHPVVPPPPITPPLV